MDAYDLPWAFTYGNHDLTPFLAKPNFINEQIVKSKNSVFVDIENDNITGLANYYINLKEKDKTIYRLYLIDSNSYRVPSDEGSGYDIIHDDQLTHIKNIVDFEGQVPGLAFFHIPLKEYSSAYLGYIKGNYEGQAHRLHHGVDRPGALAMPGLGAAAAIHLHHDAFAVRAVGAGRELVGTIGERLLRLQVLAVEQIE